MFVLANMLAAVGSFLAGLGSQASFVVIWDEPECPDSLIK